MADTTASFSVHPAPGTDNGHANGDSTEGPSLKDLGVRDYIRWNDKGVEEVPEGEAEHIQAVADQINCIQKAQWNVHRHCYSGTHARTHGIVKGTFVVNKDLPKHLQQGEIFSKGGEYPVVARYSTEPGDPGMDVSQA